MTPHTILERTHSDSRRRLAAALAVVVAAGVLQVVAGVGPSRAASARGAWINTDAMAAARGLFQEATMARLDGPACRVEAPPAYCGDVLAIGFTADNSPAPQFYDPVMGSWTIVTTPAVAGATGTVTRVDTLALLDGPDCQEALDAAPAHCGKVLMTGTFDKGQSQIVPVAFLYDPGTGCPQGGAPPCGGWTETGASPTVRHGAAVARLGDGRVFVVGGHDESGNASHRTAEIYDPRGDGTDVSGNQVTGGWETTSELAGLTGDPGQARLLPPERVNAVLLDGPECGAAGRPAHCGKVLVVSGQWPAVNPAGNPTSLPAAQLFDPTSTPGGAWALTGSPPPGQAPWRRTAVALADGSGRVVATGGFCGGMHMEGADCATRASLYDPSSSGREVKDFRDNRATGGWVASGAMSAPREGHSLTRLGDGRVLAAGGHGNALSGMRPLASAEVYDPATGAWSTTGSMLRGRYHHDAVLLGDDTVLAVGGQVWGDDVYESYTPTNTAEVFHPSMASSSRPPTIGALEPSSGPESGGSEVLVTGAGFNEVSDVRFGGIRAMYWRVESSTQMVVTAPAHPPGAFHLQVTTPAGTSAPIGAARFTFTPAVAGAWNGTGALGEARSEHTATRLDGPGCRAAARPAYCGKVLVAGGAYDAATVVASTELYDPASGTWAPAGAMSVARAAHTATVLADGRVLVTGGRKTGVSVHDPPMLRPEDEMVTAGEALSTAEIYDPTLGVWLPAGPLAVPRVDHNATLLTGPECDELVPPAYCGKVLITGGRDTGRERSDSVISETGNDYLLASHSAELYDPLTGVSALTGPFTFSLYALDDGHTATLLSHGRVLVVGGDRNDRGGAAVFEPTTRTWMETASNDSRHRHTATLLEGPACATASRPAHCGTVLVAGGLAPDDDATGSTPRVQRYEPDPGGATSVPAPVGGPPAPRWHDLSPLLAATLAHTAVALPDGNVLVVSGCTSSSFFGRRHYNRTDCLGQTQLSQLYDPASNTWVSGPVVVTSRHRHTTTVLEDGRVLTVGGYDRRGRSLASAEVFEQSARPSVARLLPASGPTSGGTAVAVTGTGLFSPDVEVRFGDQPATALLVRSERAVVAVAPPNGPGPVPVTVTTPAGSVAAGTFTYGPGAWEPTASLEDCEATSCVARVGHSATVLGDGRVLVAGGQSPGGAIASAQVFDPATATWSPTGSMASPRAFHSATLLASGKVLVVGGADVAERSATATAELFDPGPGSWSLTPSLGTARSNHSATLLPNGKVLVAGGLSGSGMVRTPTEGRDCPIPEIEPNSNCNFTARRLDVPPAPLASAEIYDPDDPGWSDTPPLTEARADHAVALVPGPAGTKVLVAGGCGETRSIENFSSTIKGGTFTCSLTRDSAELYDLSTATWSPTAPMASPQTGASAAVLANGKVLVAGGCSAFQNLGRRPFCAAFPRSAELFDPALRTWKPTGALNAPRAGGTVTPLPDGTVLVAGNAMFDFEPANDAELYHPDTGRFTRTTSLTVGRDGHTASLLHDGRVLVAGGARPGGAMAIQEATYVPAAIADTELYTLAPTVAGLSPGEGPSAGGTPVAITGANLQWVTRVKFGQAVARDVRVESTTKLTVLAPAQPSGPVQVAIASPGGVDFGRYTYVPTGHPGRVEDLAAEVVSDTVVKLSFSTVGTDGPFPPPATRYQIRLAETPIRNEEAFDAAEGLCEAGVCAFPKATVGSRNELDVDALTPGTTYFFAVRALDAKGTAGPIATVQATTTGTPPPAAAGAACRALPDPGAFQVAYPAGYSMVGLPEGTMLRANSPLYGWWDQNKGDYSVGDPAQAVDVGRGYWAWFACPRLVSLSGAGQPSVSAPLGAYRASMVGNPSGEGSATAAGFDFAARWDPAANNGAGGYQISGYREAQNLAVGEAIWAFSYVPTTVEIRR